MVENAITKVARIAAHAAQGLVYKDSSGKEQTILPAGDKNMIDISGLSIGNGSGGDTGGGDNPDHPSAGADYYAGSLADGEITERKLLWQGTTDPAKTNNLTLLEDVGVKFNMAGDGAMYLVHIQKTAMTAGVKGATSDLQLSYDPNNSAKDGYFTTTSCYPIYIATSNLSTHQELVVPINGIGENLGGKNVKAPELHVTFKDDKTMDISTVTGYCNDGADSGATGANYDIVVDLISTFSVQDAVAQMPPAVVFFNGSSSSDVALSGMSDYFENSMNGIEITFDDYLNLKTGATLFRIPFKESSIASQTYRVPKEALVVGNSIDISSLITFKPNQMVGGESRRNYNYGWVAGSNFGPFVGLSSAVIKISPAGLSIDLGINVTNTGTTITFELGIKKVTSFN